MIDAGGRQFVFVLSGDASGVKRAAGESQQSLRDVADTTTALDRAQQGATASSGNLLASLGKVGLGAFGLQQVAAAALSGAQALVQAQINADRLQMQLSAGAGAAAAGREIEYVRDVSNRLGLQLDSTAVAYARFVAAARGTSLEGRSVRAVFESVAKSAAVMGLSTDETQGALRALEQMMSKGVVQAEELRGQLGDRLPGALQIAARALGVTTKELQAMVERGEVLAVDFLPRFAEQLDKEVGQGADKAATAMGAAVNRMGNAWEQLKQDIAGSGVGEFMKGQLEIAADGFNSIGEAMRRAKEQGGGFWSQMASGTGQLLLFLNPFNALSYSARSLGGELQQAEEKLASLKRELVTNPGNIFLRPAIKETEELIARLKQAQELRAGLVDQSGAETARLAGYERAARGGEEAAARRREALAKVTGELTKKNDRLVQSVKVLTDAFNAGDLQRGDYDRLVGLAYAEYGPKDAKGPKPKSLLTAQVYETPAMAFSRFERGQQAQVEEAFRRDKLAEDQRDRQQREREAQQYEKRREQADRFADHLESTTAQISAQSIADGYARGQALLAIERAQLTSRLDVLKLNGEDRLQVEDQIARYLVAREEQLTEDLKPEWQRRLEQWQDVHQLMRDSYDTLMGGIVDEGERAFSDWLRTGKLNTRNLVAFIGDEFAKLGYRKYLAGGVSQGGDWLLGLLGMGAMNVDAGGYGIGMTRTDGMVGLPTRGGAATGTNFVQRDMLTILHKGEAVIPRAFNPWGDAAPARPMAASAPPVIQNIVYHVPPGQSPAAYAAVLEANNVRIKGEVASDMARPGRALQRAARAAQA